MSLRDLQIIALVSVSIALCGCDSYRDDVPEHKSAPVNVVLAMSGGVGTRTVYDAADRKFVWQPGDRIAVWARNSEGTYSLEGQTFSMMAKGSGRSDAYFTATLQSPMEEGEYSYIMTYPVPESFHGTTAAFSVPAVQDGAASGGVDVLVAEPVSGPELRPIPEAAPVDPDDVMNVRMRHLLHFLRFYIPEGCNSLGEPLTRIEFSMPQPIAGKVSVDVTDASTASLSEGEHAMTLVLKSPLDEFSDGTLSAVAGIFPPQTAYSAGDRMTVKAYSEHSWASVPVPLSGRDFPAGHITGVPLRLFDAKPIEYELKFVLASNNLGEDPQSVRITLPDGEVWPGTDSPTLTIDGSGGGLAKVGDAYTFSTQDGAFFKGLSSKEVAVEYESESALVSETVILGDLSLENKGVCELNCPYLFFEDFSWVKDFSSDDQYGMSSAGSKSPELFAPYELNEDRSDWDPNKGGWSAARAGAQEGTAIRIACRRETRFANYSARADSPFLTGLKEGKAVSLRVQYDYSMNREGGPKISQTVNFGYVNNSNKYSSGDTAGSFPVKFNINETTGSYSNINHTADATLSNVQAPIRLTWSTVPETNWGANNNTCWLYLDNIKVMIKK